MKSDGKRHSWRKHTAEELPEVEPRRSCSCYGESLQVKMATPLKELLIDEKRVVLKTATQSLVVLLSSPKLALWFKVKCGHKSLMMSPSFWGYSSQQQNF
ncbi:uncharacterized protein LOC110889207 isoform X2 [Helianthus annuus]|uniref:uncharacterized protein LOC110889207 isoform X2 n=1 Tax=Helianthus annuus TaxID=4232 RepID=UPI000B902BB7|nr:uncharacterized protein LOC110889207 isoform X2 [Helianthus annuus]